MAWAFVQDDVNIVDDGTSGTTLAKAFGSNVTTGNHIYVWCGWSNSDTDPTVADSLGNTYTIVGSRVFDATNSQGMAQFHAENITGGACTVTVTFGSSVPYRRMGIIEHSGLATSASLDVNAGQVLAAPGTGTDAATSGAVTTTQNNDLVVGAYQNIADASPGSATLTQGTNYTAREKTGTGIGMMEDRNLVSAGSVAATFTISLDKRCIVMVAAFKEPAAAGARVVKMAGIYRGYAGGSGGFAG